MASIQLYTTAWCGHCVRAKMLPQVTFGIAVRMAVMSIISGNDA